MNKNILKSRTFWFGLLSALAPLVPALKELVIENTVAVAAVWGTLTMVLRYVTKDKVILID